MAEDHDTTALVIGGGIGGLTTALALRRYGIDSLVFEQADQLHKSQSGSGLILHVNVARAFKHLDLLDEVAEVGAPIKRFQTMTAEGRHLGTAPMVEGELTQGVLRPAVHGLLADAVGADPVRMDAKLVRFEQDGGGVTAHFADGRRARGEVLIGADGFDSAVRKQLLGESEPRYAGYVTRRGVLETDTPEGDELRIVLGRGQRFTFVPVGRGLTYWTASVNGPAGAQESAAEIKQTVLERFRGWPEPVEKVVEGTDESRTFLADTVDRDPVKRWGEGRVTLLGDAAHPMTWDRGQGAGQAIEGAVLLAKALAGADDPASALRAWEAERIPRTSKIVRDSRRLGKLMQIEKPLLSRLRNEWLARGMASRIADGLSKGLLVEY